MMGDQKIISNLPSYKDKEKHKGGSLGSPNIKHDVGMMTYKEDVVYVSVLTENMSGKYVQIMMAEIGEAVMDYLVEK